MQRQAKTATPKTAPTTENGTAPPRREPNDARRPREYLTPEEVRLLLDAAATVSRNAMPACSLSTAAE